MSHTGGFLKAFDVIDSLIPGGNPSTASPSQSSESTSKPGIQPTPQQSQQSQPIPLAPQSTLTTSKLTDRTCITPTRQRSQATQPVNTATQQTQASRIAKPSTRTTDGKLGIGDELVKAATDITNAFGDVALGMGSVFGSVLDSMGKGVTNGVNSSAEQVMGAAGLTDFAIKRVLQANLAPYAHFSPMSLKVHDQGDRIVLSDAVACEQVRLLVPVDCLQIKMDCATILGVTSSYMDSLPGTPITPVKMRVENIHITIALTMVQGWALRLFLANPTLESFIRDTFLFKDLFLAWSCDTMPSILGGFRINAALFNAEHTDRISTESELVIHAMYLSDVVFSVHPLKGPGCYRIEIETLNIDVNPSKERIATLKQLLDMENAPKIRRKRDVQIKSIALGVLVCLCAILYQLLT
ncbi:hypothetical protein SARC_05425 [Sphaeroforma arctica JP610]|uniref:Uncharacterized protein n=1 Tax=Sphaeroforma arctica JP610 TaxID=667725 RepID=A0A0L0G0C8_9EUKA|nr:hypothetical protein SARC_05425 [Sphaeroforma arctica JP610]KNC82291.1 hypothetical protein SARC_05425 [Sphaeroforma arctica JP610]|eukprot:XP_014156193.1 hypothetical protein SARC_05425 [Sphaeroforma arctica JP610]